MSKSLLLGDSRLPPTRSYLLEDWEGVGGEDNAVGGTHCGFPLGPQSVVEVGEEGEGEGEEEGAAVEKAVEQVEGKMEASMTGVEGGSGRKAGEGVGVEEGEEEDEGEVCAPCWLM